MCRKRHRISSVSRELIYGIAQCIAKTYNIPYSIYKNSKKDKYTIENRIVNQRDVYLVTYDFSKKIHSFYENGYVWSPLRNVFNTNKLENVYDIEIDAAHSFTANGCIVHNCQDISVAGIQRGIQKGTRSGLLYEVERIVEYNKPKYLMMENVKNLVSNNHLPKFKEFISKLSSFGYGNSWLILNGADYGCPQNRERVFMMSVLGETDIKVEEKLYGVLNMKIPRVTMKTYMEKEVDEKLYLNYPFEMKDIKKNSVCKLIARRTDIKYDQMRRIYSVDGCSPCLTTSGSPQIMLENGKVRKISAREGYRFMGVKEEDIDKLLTTNLSTSQHVSLAGNSICVPVMEQIFKQFFGEYIF
jgi:DNA-cytosine methyltransferase